ncbi:MAG: hypothetical protein LBL74_00390 [Bacteroidales bacterium]|jgi:tetratricopeptide (TPR) repeat protein|nr:hypothetical protein [Bacteroidales bacterium]
METKEIISYKKALQIFGGYCWKVFLAVGAICGVFGFLITKTATEYWLLYIIIVLSLTVLVSLALLVCNLINREIADKTNLDIPALLYDILKRATEEEYTTLRRGIDRYLHLYGHPDIRKKIVDLGKDKNPEDTIISLIDNLGWASYQSGKNKLAAIRSIETGIKMAVQNGLFYYAAKGERHLSGIAKHSGDKENCKSHLDKSECYTKQIPEAVEKIEMQGSIYLAKAKLFLDEPNLDDANLDDAKKYATLAFESFKNDVARQVKVYSVKGNICLKCKDYEEARTIFLDGYKACKNIRKDERAKNAFGLAKIYNEPESGMMSKEESLKYAKEALGTGEKALKQHEFTEVESFYKGLTK